MKSSKIKVTKIEAAERQIETSIFMFFRNDDALSIHTVTCAGLGVMEALAKQYNKKSSISLIEELVVEHKRGEMKRLLNKPQNFLKHADKDPEDILEYNPNILEYYLFFACNSYHEFTGKMTDAIWWYMLWFSMVHPNLLSFPGKIQQESESYVKKHGVPKSNDDKLLILKAIENRKR